MSFAFGNPLELRSPHSNSISKIIYSPKTSIFAAISPDAISFWKNGIIAPKLVGTVPHSEIGDFSDGCFIDHLHFAALTNLNYLISIDTQKYSQEEVSIKLDVESKLVYIKRIGKFLYLLYENGKIRYVLPNLSKMHSKEISVPDKIVSAGETNESMFLHLANNQIYRIVMNTVEVLRTPYASKMEVCPRSGNIYLFCRNSEWQVWKSTPPTYITNIPLKSDDVLISPILSTLVFCKKNILTITNRFSIISEIVIDNMPYIEKKCFDSLGQTLMMSYQSKLYYIDFATTGSPFLMRDSVPFTKSSILLPFKDTLKSINYPDIHKGKFTCIGKSYVFLATTKGFAVLDLPPGLRTEGDCSQLIKSNYVEFNPKWHIVNGYNIKLATIVNDIIVVYHLSKDHIIEGFKISEDDVKSVFKINLTEKPIDLSSSNGSFIISYKSRFEIYSLENLQKPHKKKLSEDVLMCSYYHGDSIAVLTVDYKLSLISDDKLIASFYDIYGFQPTGSANWPLLAYSNSIILIGANRKAITIDDAGIFLGVDGFRILSASPFALFDFVDKVISNALDENNPASATSILSQEPPERRVSILSKVGPSICQTAEGIEKFTSFLSQFESEADVALEAAFAIPNVVGVDYLTIFNQLIGCRRYKAASQLIKFAGAEASVDLMVKSEFEPIVVGRVFGDFPKLFTSNLEYFDTNDILRSKLIDKLNDFLRLKLATREFERVGQLIPYLRPEILQFLLQNRRQKWSVIFEDTVNALRNCDREATEALESVAIDAGYFELAFCLAFRLKDYTTCVLCVEMCPFIRTMVNKDF